MLPILRYSVILLTCWTAGAATTYYVDWTGGADGNAGTSTAAAWKRHPYMAGWSGSYSHSAGDTFIFKGGETWPSNCFPMTIAAGGSGSNYDRYTISNGWFTGGTWSRPVFDFEDTPFGNDTLGAGVLISVKNNIVIDNFELKRHRAKLAPDDTFSYSIAVLNQSTNILVINCLIRDWTMVTPMVNGGDGNTSGGFGYAGSGGSSIIASNCVLHQANVSQKTGAALHDQTHVINCTIYETCNGYIGGGILASNLIYNIRDATDPLSHENVIEVFTPSTIYQNLLYGAPAGIAGILCSPAFSVPAGGITTIFNNVIYNCGQALALDSEGQASNSTIRVWNNTIVHTNSYCIRVVDRNNTGIGVVDIRNNHFITDYGTPVCYNSSPTCGPVLVATNANNITNSTSNASAQGYVTGNHFAPTASSTYTLNNGIDLSAQFTNSMNSVQRAVPWDIGAYEYVNPAVTNISRSIIGARRLSQ